MELNSVNKRLKEEIAMLNQDKERQAKEFKEAEEELKAQMAELRKEKDEALQEIETTNAKLL